LCREPTKSAFASDVANFSDLAKDEITFYNRLTQLV